MISEEYVDREKARKDAEEYIKSMLEEMRGIDDCDGAHELISSLEKIHDSISREEEDVGQ
jgi:hypothetical protein